MTQQVSLLVVALDADLREAAFTCLTGAGYRIDAVANLDSARKRLSKDEYALIVRSREFEPVAVEEEKREAPAELAFDVSCIGEELEKRVRDALGKAS